MKENVNDMSGTGLCWECRKELKTRGYNVDDLAELYHCSHDSPDESCFWPSFLQE
jgi:hypothetical protein